MNCNVISCLGAKFGIINNCVVFVIKIKKIIERNIKKKIMGIQKIDKFL